MVMRADAKPSIQARERIHPSMAPAAGRVQRVEHEYERMGSVCYFDAWDVRRGGVIGRSERMGAIASFDRLVWQVMTKEPYARRPDACSGSSTTALITAGRPRSSAYRAAGATWSSSISRSRELAKPGRDLPLDNPAQSCCAPTTSRAPPNSLAHSTTSSAATTRSPNRSTGRSPATTSQTSSPASRTTRTTLRSRSPPDHDRTCGGQHLGRVGVCEQGRPKRVPALAPTAALLQATISETSSDRSAPRRGLVGSFVKDYWRLHGTGFAVERPSGFRC